ncbi:MAG TPA: hypothetical protein VG847_10170 [Chitinophagaceae bacterium]|nr:hypothetical protein [Chitinophagaceae bacterium]
MKKVFVVVAVATLYVLCMQSAPYSGIDIEIIFGLFFFLPFVILYMTYVILKYGKPSSHTFEERFYDDWDYTRNSVKHANESDH